MGRSWPEDRKKKLKRVKIVIAGSILDYQRWLRDQSKSPKTYRIVTSMLNVRGIEIKSVSLAYRWQESPLMKEPYFEEFKAKLTQDGLDPDEVLKET